MLLVGGFGAPTRAMGPLQAWLERLGYEPRVSCWHHGLDCGERTARRLIRELESFGDPPILLAHSRGGQFARVAIRRRPELVRGFIAVGTPFAHLALQPLVLGQAALLSVLGSLGWPNVVGMSCVYGSCCAGFRSDLAAPWPRSVPFVSIYSPSDGTVKGATCHDPAATNVEIDATHVGMLSSVESFTAIASALAEVRA